MFDSIPVHIFLFIHEFLDFVQDARNCRVSKKWNENCRIVTLSRKARLEHIWFTREFYSSGLIERTSISSPFDLISGRAHNHLLIKSVSIGHLNMTKYLVENGADVTYDGGRVIGEAAASGNIEIVKYIVGMGVDVTAGYNYALRWASHNGHLEIVKYLVSMGADITVNDNYAVRAAAENRHPEVVNYLVSIIQCHN